MVKPLADRYGASSVLVATAAKSGNGLQVSLAHIKPDGRNARNGAYAAQGSEDEFALAHRAAGTIADSLQEDWKRTTSVDYGQQSSVTVAVPFASLSEWVATKRSLQATRVIQVLAVEEFNMRGARVRLDYVGKLDQLQTALSQTNLYLNSDTQGNWTLGRNAGATAANPGSVVP
jgi:RNA 3'-terminal phosphate cyclase